MAKATFDPDQNLVVEQFDQLNQEFYSGRPHSYLRQRMCSIVLMCGESVALVKALEKPVVLGDFGIQGPHLRLPEESADDYSTMDAIVLFHHAAETLLKLYLAHRNAPPCPWLEMSRRSKFPDFKREVAAFVDSLGDEATQSTIMQVFRGPAASDMASHNGHRASG